MTSAELHSTCLTLFGQHWQTGLARFLKRDDGTHVNVRTVRRWASGKVAVPVAVELLLKVEVERRFMPHASSSAPTELDYPAAARPPIIEGTTSRDGRG